MVAEVHERLSVGDADAAGLPGYAVVHAAKHPWHRDKVGNPRQGDPGYLWHAEGHELWLNMIDPDRPLFQAPMFAAALDWMRERWEAGEHVLVHCNQGRSRAPSLAMLFLAHVLRVIPRQSYDEAVSAFLDLYPDYQPGLGIKTFLASQWEGFLSIKPIRVTGDTNSADTDPAADGQETGTDQTPDGHSAGTARALGAGWKQSKVVREQEPTDGYTLAEIHRIADDPELWARLYAKIPERDTNEPVPFVPSPLQRRLFAWYRRCRDTCREHGVINCDCGPESRGVPVRVVMPKIRRGGGSLAAQIILYCHAHNYVARMGAIGTTSEVSGNMFRYTVYLNKHDEFPYWPRAEKVLESGYIRWPNGSEIDAHYTADNPEAARSAGLQCYHACGAEGTPVPVENGRIIPIEDVRVGDSVITHSGASATVTAVTGKQNTKGDLVAITPWLGEETRWTFDHKIPTSRGLIPACDIQVGDEVSMPIREIRDGVTPDITIPIPEHRPQGGGRVWKHGGEVIPKTHEVGYAIGYYLAEGHIKRGGISLCCHRKEVAYALRAARALEPWSDSHKLTDCQHSLRSRVSIYGGGLARAIEGAVGRVDGKHLPDWVFNSGRDFCMGVLQGYLQGDGSKTVPDTKHNGRLNRISVTSIHSSLAMQIRDLAAALGFGWASLRHKAASTKGGRNAKSAWVVTWNGDAAKRLAQFVGAEWVEKRRRHHGDAPKWRIEDGKVWIKVRQVRRVTGDTSVWDIEVDHPDHTFRTAWFSVSNSEVGRWPNGGVNDAGKTLVSMLGAVPKRGFTVVIEESTAQGATGAFYDRFMSARWPEDATWWRRYEHEYPQNIDPVAKDLQFVRIFAAWYEDEENVPHSGFDDTVAKLIQASLTPREKELIAKYGNDGPQGKRLGWTVTKATMWQQLAWRRSVIQTELQGDEEWFAQEYPSSPREAFAASGRHTFNPVGVEYTTLIAKSQSPRKGILSQQHDDPVAFTPTDDSGAWFQVWEEPRAGHRYLLCVDTMSGSEQSQGSRTRDSHAASILRADYIDERGVRHPIEQVASLIPESNVEPDLLALQTVLMSRYYGGCIIIPEINNTGYGYLTEVKKYNPHLYQRQQLDRVSGISTNKLGWLTTAENRQAIIARMQAHMRFNSDESSRDKGIIINCPVACYQFSKMIRSPKGKDEATAGCHDDEVMAICIGAYNIDLATRLPDRHRHRRHNMGSWKPVGARNR